MKTLVARLTAICISFMVMGLSLTDLSYAEIDWETVVGIWRFDKGQGDRAEDSSGKENHGQITGAEWVEGKVGTALKFTGRGRVEVVNSDSLALSDAFTVMAWANVHVFVTNAAVVAKGTNKGFWALEVVNVTHAPNGWKIRLNSPPDTNAQGDYPHNKTGVWSHLTMVVDGRTNKGLKLYVDGKLKLPVIDNFIVGDIVSPEPLYIGFELRNGKYFLGTIDEVVILNSALNPKIAEKDIQSVMKKGVALARGQAVSPKGKIAVTWGNIKAKSDDRRYDGM